MSLATKTKESGLTPWQVLISAAVRYQADGATEEEFLDAARNAFRKYQKLYEKEHRE